MNLPAWGAFALAAIASAGDLGSILRHHKRFEHAPMPAVMVLLIAASVLLHPARQGERALFVAALVLGLAGDVFLMLPDDYLIPGIAAFLAGHLAYAAGFRFVGFAIFGLVAGLVIVAATAVLVLRRILIAAESGGPAHLRNPVVCSPLLYSLMPVDAAANDNL